MTLRTLLLTGLLALLLATPCQAYLLEGKLGYPIDRYGTKYSTSSGTISVKFNALAGSGTMPYYSSWYELSASDRSRLSSLVAAAVEQWNKVPDCTLKLSFDGSIRTTTAVARRPYILISIGDMPYGVGGVAYSSSYSSQIIPSGVIVRRGSGIGTVIQELGHQLGLGHSHLGWRLTYNSTFGYTSSVGAFMSYSRRGGGGTLHGDDIAAIASHYPNSSFGSSTGSISGELSGVFGANVFVVDSSKKAVVARLSGLHEFAGAGRHGKFKLPRLAPGSYTLVAASPYDSTFRSGSSRGGYTRFDSYSPTSLAVSIIKSIVVKAGSDTALGKFSAGTRKTLTGGGSTTPAPTPTPEPEPEPKPETRTLTWGAVSGASYYYIQIYSYAAGKWLVRRAVSGTSITFETTAGKHYVYLHAYVSGSWRQIASQSITL